MASSLGCSEVTRLSPESWFLASSLQCEPWEALRPLPRWLGWATRTLQGPVLFCWVFCASAWSRGNSSPLCLPLIAFLCCSVESYCSLSFHAALVTFVSQLSVPMATCDVVASLCPHAVVSLLPKGPKSTLVSVGSFSHTKPLCPGQLYPQDARLRVFDWVPFKSDIYIGEVGPLQVKLKN